MSDLTRRAAGQFMLAAPAALALNPTAADARGVDNSQVNGLNVTTVQTQNSRFSLDPMRRWTETASSGATFDFVERARDERSVYLSDDTRGVRLQMDVYRALVLYADEGEPQMRPLYPITGISSVVNGWNVIFARVASGRYIMTSPRIWVEQGNDGVEFTFTEESRDDWSAYLTDPSRGIRLQIDLHRNLILYSNQSASEMRPLYPITAATAITA